MPYERVELAEMILKYIYFSINLTKIIKESVGSENDPLVGGGDS